jgi:uncharacterized surface protein with fasciclin (FAS1) repeats
MQAIRFPEAESGTYGCKASARASRSIASSSIPPGRTPQLLMQQRILGIARRALRTVTLKASHHEQRFSQMARAFATDLVAGACQIGQRIFIESRRARFRAAFALQCSPVAGQRCAAQHDQFTRIGRHVRHYAGSFNTLVTAVQAAGLVDTLKGPGPFTVFAPTDEAFAKIPKAKLDALLKDKAALTRVLTYHVVPGKVMVGNAKVVKTDVAADNGVIHVIDAVIMP